MSFLNIIVTNARELSAVPAGEYKLRIMSAEHNEEKCFVLTRLQIVGPADPADYAATKDVSHFLYLPKADDDAKKVENKQRALRKFMDAFGIPYSEDGVDLGNFQGCEGWAILKEEEDETYGAQNRIKSLQKPRA
jgi:hypothetical protein